MKEDKIIFPWDNNIETSENIIKLGARQCKIIKPTIEEVYNFLNKYHYQKSCLGQIIRYGLSYKNKLIAIMTFGYPRYNKRFQYELLRLCFHPNYSIIGGSKKLFNKFIKDYTPNSIISYCDKSKFTGNVYISLGMKLISNGRPAKHFWREEDKRHITNIELLKYGADKLIGTSEGKGTNNIDILLKHNFKIIEDYGQDTYLYLDKNQYYGYIYCITDNSNNKKYVGQHIGSKFDENYLGSGNIITKLIKKRPQDFTIDVLEWCKQDISEREIYYIHKLNTLVPNGYNLTDRPQAFSYSNPGRPKDYYIENGKKIAKFYASKEGKEISKRIAQKRHEYCQTEEGKQWLKQRSEKFSEYCKSDNGKLMCQKRNQKLKDLNKTKEGKIKEQKRIQSLKDFYNSEEGRIAKQQQIEKIKKNPNYEQIKKNRSESYKQWANTKEGKKKLSNSRLESLKRKANSMSEEEWNDFLKKYPGTRLINYRNK